MAGVYAKLVVVALIVGGTLIALPVAAAEMHRATAALWRYVLATLTLLGAVIFINRVPVVAFTLGVLLLDERLEPALVAAGPLGGRRHRAHQPRPGARTREPMTCC